MEQLGVSSVAQHPITVLYEGQTVGEYFCDLLAENKVIVEIKAEAILAV